MRKLSSNIPTFSSKYKMLVNFERHSHLMLFDASTLNPWYFPSIGTYTSLLEQYGFHVVYAKHIDRPLAYKEINEQLRIGLFHDDVWIADYKRIRVYAIKK